MKKKPIIIAVVFIVAAVCTFLILTNIKRAQREEEREKVSTLTQADCDALVAEKLPEGLEAELSNTTVIDSQEYYLYNIQRDGEELDQMLAVNSVSGEVSVYNEDEDALEDYSTFAAYDEKLDDNIEWTGEYAGDAYVISIEEQDPGSFELSATPAAGGDAKTGFAYKDNGVEAKANLDGEEITMTLKGGELTVKGAKLDGTYRRK